MKPFVSVKENDDLWTIRVTRKRKEQPLVFIKYHPELAELIRSIGEKERVQRNFTALIRAPYKSCMRNEEYIYTFTTPDWGPPAPSMTSSSPEPYLGHLCHPRLENGIYIKPDPDMSPDKLMTLGARMSAAITQWLYSNLEDFTTTTQVVFKHQVDN